MLTSFKLKLNTALWRASTGDVLWERSEGQKKRNQAHSSVCVPCREAVFSFLFKKLEKSEQ